MTDPNIGRVFADRYQLVELIGKGAMGRVYRAKHTLLDAPVAVKFLAHTLLNKKMRDRFKREARACFLLGQKSKHIVQVLDYGVSEDEVPFYVMEYLQGRDLSAIVKRESIPLPRFLNLAHQICLGLQSAHQGILLEDRLCPIIHRDIKPSNILVVPDPDVGESVKILDFGIAKLLQEDSNQTSHFMGTLAYSAPEQMEGEELDNRADIYSFGVVMYEMLSGKMPLQADTHSFGGWYKAHHEQAPRPFAETNPMLRLPKPLERLVLSCLSKNPADRPQSVNEILQALEPMEHRYRPGRSIGLRIENTLSRTGVPEAPEAPEGSDSEADGQNGDVPLTRADVPPETICRLQSWPADKPVAEIVFPRIIPTSRQKLATVWVMLPVQAIRAIQISDELSSLYSRFMGSLVPHPMVLWLTVLYARLQGVERKPKWLPCYIDLKRDRGLQLAQALSEQGRYYVLFFATEAPQNCAHVVGLNLSPSHRQMLQQWLEKSKDAPAGEASAAKVRLKEELDRAKPQILKQLRENVNA